MLWSFFVYTMGSVCTVKRTAQCSKRGTKKLIWSDFSISGKHETAKTMNLEMWNNLAICKSTILLEFQVLKCNETYTHIWHKKSKSDDGMIQFYLKILKHMILHLTLEVRIKNIGQFSHSKNMVVIISYQRFFYLAFGPLKIYGPEPINFLSLYWFRLLCGSVLLASCVYFRATISRKPYIKGLGNIWITIFCPFDTVLTIAVLSAYGRMHVSQTLRKLQ